MGKEVLPATSIQVRAARSGFSTSEFYVAVITALVPVINTYFNLHIPTEAVASLVGVAASYILGRSYVKGKALE